MIKEYLDNRMKLLSGIIQENENKIEHNNLLISEAENKINQIKDNVDDAAKIFSVKAREDMGYNNKKIKELDEKISFYKKEIDEFTTICKDMQKEIDTVKKCIEEMGKNNVSRETSSDINNPSYSKAMINSNVIAKLNFCKSIARLDPTRTINELDNVISMLKLEKK